jgi:hypothetical protein
MSKAAIIGVVAVLLMSSSAGAVFMMGGDDGPSSPGPSSPGPAPAPAPAPPIMLEDGKPYTYQEGKLYECTSGKDVGCLYRNQSGGIAAAAGMYDATTKSCPNGDHVYCMNPKTVTMAQYSDNVAAGTGTWQQTMHRYAAEGKRCPTPENANCQDDQSIAQYQGWGGGNTAKITTRVTDRQCVDNAFLYC